MTLYDCLVWFGDGSHANYAGLTQGDLEAIVATFDRLGVVSATITANQS